MKRNSGLFATYAVILVILVTSHARTPFATYRSRGGAEPQVNTISKSFYPIPSNTAFTNAIDDRPNLQAKKERKHGGAFKRILIIRGGARTNKSEIDPTTQNDAASFWTYARLGDAGNYICLLLSLLLMFAVYKPDVAAKYGIILDDCFKKNNFCVTKEQSLWWNSHMTSFYTDTIGTLILYYLIKGNWDRIKELQLDDYLCQTGRVMAIFGHGLAHLFFGLANAYNLQELHDMVMPVCLILLMFFYFQSKMNGGEGLVPKLKDRFPVLRNNLQWWHHGPFFLPLLAYAMIPTAPLHLRQNFESGSSSNNKFLLLLGYSVFFFFNLIIFEAGTPHMNHKTPFMVLSAVLVSLFFRLSGRDDVDYAFTVVFTATNAVVSASMTLFFDRKDSFEYLAVSSLLCLSTLVGWVLALFCRPIQKLGVFGGHVWYDMSFPLFYCVLFYICDFHARFIEEKNAKKKM